MHEVLPNFVTVGDDDTPWSVNYNALFSYSIGAVKELDAIVQQQQNRILQLENENTIIKNALNNLLSAGGHNTI